MFHYLRQISIAVHASSSFSHVFMFSSIFSNESKGLETDGTQSVRSYQAVNQNILCTYVVLALAMGLVFRKCICFRVCESYLSFTVTKFW